MEDDAKGYACYENYGGEANDNGYDGNLPTTRYLASFFLSSY